MLATGQTLERNSAGNPENAAVITLLVSPDDAQKLTLASSQGRIQLSLRNPLDLEQKNPATIERNTLFWGAKPAPVAVKPAPRPKVASKPVAPAVIAPPAPVERKSSVEVFLGQKKETLTFKEGAE